MSDRLKINQFNVQGDVNNDLITFRFPMGPKEHV